VTERANSSNEKPRRESSRKSPETK